MVDLMRNPPPNLASDDLLARFPTMRSSPAIVRMLKASASAAKRQSVMNLPANLVSERQAYFEGEVEGELRKLESSKEWFDIQKYIESYYGITLVASSGTHGVPAMPPLPGSLPSGGMPLPPLPPMPPTANLPPTPPTSRPRTPPAPSSTPTPSRTPPPRSHTPPARPSTPQGKHGVNGSLLRSLALLGDVTATWAAPDGKEYLALAAPINEFLFHYRSSGATADTDRIAGVLEEMEGMDAATGELAPEDPAAWKPRVDEFVADMRAHLETTVAATKKQWATQQLARLRDDLFAQCTRHFRAVQLLKARRDDPVDELRSGAVLAHFFNWIMDGYEQRLRDLGLSPADLLPASPRLMPSVSAAPALGAGTDSPPPPSSYSLLDATLNWNALAAAMASTLGLSVGDWGIRPLGLPRNPDAVRLVTVLLGFRCAQLTLTPGIVSDDDMESLVEYFSVLHPEHAATAAASVHSLPHSLMGSGLDATRFPVNSSGTLIRLPLSSTSTPKTVTLYECAVAKQTVVAARSQGRVLRATEVKGARAVWLYQRYLRVLEILQPHRAADHPSLVTPTLVEMQGLGLPPLPLEAVPRDWMPLSPNLYFVLADSDASPGTLPLDAYLLRHYAYRKCLVTSGSSSSSSIKIDRDRAYDVNRLLLQIFKRIAEALAYLHEQWNLAHGSVEAAHVLVVGDAEAGLRASEAVVKLLPPSLALGPPPSFTPGQESDYDSTLASDVRALGDLFHAVLSRFWFTRPLVSSSTSTVAVGPTPPDSSDAVTATTSEAPAPADEQQVVPPSLEMHHEHLLMRQSTASMSSSGSGSRPSSSAITSVYGALPPLTPTGTSFPGNPLDRSGNGTLTRSATTTKKKKRPITIHLAPSIHPPWSPLYNEAATTVIQRPNTPEAPDAVPPLPSAETMPPVPPLPNSANGGSSATQHYVSPSVRPRTPSPPRDLANTEQDRAMNEILDSLTALVARMRDANETNRPVIREVLEYF
ncbi:hypothetical protein H9P43_005280 [Blastocladiella emersonii ATCC 22665]|nr:hypothetical protein H9P43_005280 [Blastocladiella emersonii ATCC 22665]